MKTDREGVEVSFTDHETKHLIHEIERVQAALPDIHLQELGKLLKKLSQE